MIKHLPNGKWQVMAESGKAMGTYDSEEEAKKRLKQVEMFKHMKGKRDADHGDLADRLMRD